MRDISIISKIVLNFSLEVKKSENITSIFLLLMYSSSDLDCIAIISLIIPLHSSLPYFYLSSIGPH